MIKVRNFELSDNNHFEGFKHISNHPVISYWKARCYIFFCKESRIYTSPCCSLEKWLVQTSKIEITHAHQEFLNYLRINFKPNPTIRR